MARKSKRQIDVWRNDNKSSGIKTTDKLVEWAYTEILKAQDRRETFESVAWLIVLAAAKWGGENALKRKKKGGR